MSPPNVSNLLRSISGIGETVRYAPGALVRDGLKQALNVIPGARSAKFLRRRMRSRRPLRGPLVLMYHRIADHDPDPWALSVSSQHFAEQMELVARYRRPMALTEFVSGGKVAEVPANAVAVTFDDGYADNLLAAKPVLERYGMPATVFVTSVAVDHPGELWWDELERVLLAPDQLPLKLPLTVCGRELSFSGGSNSPDLQSHRRAAFADRAGHRWLVYKAIYEALLAAPYAEKMRVLGELALLLGLKPGGRSGRRLLQARELQQLASCNLVEIGCHTETHPVLAGLSKDDQQVEISRNKTFLEGLLDRPFSSFAYPYGSYDAKTIICVRRAGFTLACHTRTGPVERNASPFEMPRLHVCDWDGDRFLQVLSPTQA
jgi:peptidoglycan/xylan/chitin deacetylase (PgdA/CDA1 family)